MDTPKYVIRRATELDLPSIQRLNKKLFEKEFHDYDNSLKTSWLYNDGEKYFRNAILNGYVAVALCDEELIGYLAGSFDERSYRNRNIAELDNMFIEPEHRNNGVGTMLIDDFVKYCTGYNVDLMRVTAYCANHNAIEFYRKNGFADFELTLKREFE